MADDGTIKIGTELDTKGVEKAMSKFSGIVKAGVKGVAVAVGAVATAMTGAGGMAIKSGIEFESAFAGVKKTVNATAEEMDGLRQGIRDMSKNMPQSASSIAEVAEAAGQLGIKTENILDFTEVMSNLGVATNMSSTEAATALARLANITRMPQDQFGQLGSTIVSLGNNLATTESEITEMGLRLAGAGKQVGMSEADILGLAGALSSVGIEADAGGSAVSTVLAKMQIAVEKGGKSLDEFASVAGMTGAQFKQAFQQDASAALISFVTGLGKMDDQGKSAIGTLDDMGITEVRQRDALLRLSGAGDLLTESIGIATNAWAENNALTKEAQQRYETLESKLKVFKNNLTDLGISIYGSLRDPLKNTVEQGIEYVERLADAFQSGGLPGAVAEAGSIFADIATKAAEQAPQMIDSAIEFIKAFAGGIYENRGQLMKAVKDIVKTIAEGLTDLLPRGVQKPVKEAIKAIEKSFAGGGLKKAVKTVANLFESIGKAAEKVTKAVLPPFVKIVDKAADNLDVLVPLLAAGIAAYKLATDDAVSGQERLNQVNEELGEAFAGVGEAASNFYTGIQSAGSIFDNFR